MQRRHALTEEQWSQIAPLLPPEVGRVARPAKSNRLMVEGIVWILRTGAPSRDLPKRFGPWKSVYTRFRRWTRQGVWARVLERLAEQQDPESYLIDATIVRAHQDATGAKKGDPKQSATLEADQPQRFTLLWTHSEMRFVSH
jgi:transposase